MHELDDRLSIVKRWGIIRTIKSQSVAEHCFNVQRICIKLAPYFGIDDFEEMFELSQAALHHDDDEAVVGDIPGPAKVYIQTDEKGVDVGATAWYTDASDEFKDIVKLADMLEAYHFLAMEFNMGNSYIRSHRASLKGDIMDYIYRHPDWPDSIVEICTIWMNSIEIQISKVHPDGIVRSPEKGTRSG